jgi:hypothetical protein
MKARVILVPILILITTSFIQGTKANNVEWNYGNYLQSLEIISYAYPATAGNTASIAVEIGANTDVVLHIELKGYFDWGNWTFSSTEIPIESSVTRVTGYLEVPYKTMIEAESYFYYYVYVTLPGDGWTASTWGLTENVTVDPPSEVIYDEFADCMSHLKWLVDTSSLSDGVRQNLFEKLELAGLKIEAAYVSGNFNLLNVAKDALREFGQMLESDGEASEYPDSELWGAQACYIVQRIDVALS